MYTRIDGYKSIYLRNSIAFNKIRSADFMDIKADYNIR